MKKYTITTGYGFNADGAPLKMNATQARESIEKIMQIATRVEGWALFECFGGWVNNAGVLVREPSMRVEFVSDCGDEYAMRVALCVRDTLEQNSVFFEAVESSACCI